MHVKIPLPIGFFDLTDSLIKALIVALEIKLKCGVSPLITHPSATKPSNFLIFLAIITGISKTPWAFINSYLIFFFC